MRRLLLASTSPRRRSLIDAFGLPVEVRGSEADESVPLGTPPDVMVREAALRKAEAVVSVVDRAEVVVVAADTTVALDGAWLGKPQDAADATEMLTRLQGRSHAVFTGVAVLGRAAHLTDVTMTTVGMVGLTGDEIAAYVASGEGLDKAGSYGIQGPAGQIVSHVEGCYTNVVGLPLCALAVLIASVGVAIDAPAPPCGHRSDRRCPHPIWRDG